MQYSEDSPLVKLGGMSPKEINSGLVTGKMDIKPFLIDLISALTHLASPKESSNKNLFIHIMSIIKSLDINYLAENFRQETIMIYERVGALKMHMTNKKANDISDEVQNKLYQGISFYH